VSRVSSCYQAQQPIMLWPSSVIMPLEQMSSPSVPTLTPPPVYRSAQATPSWLPPVPTPPRRLSPRWSAISYNLQALLSPTQARPVCTTSPHHAPPSMAPLSPPKSPRSPFTTAPPGRSVVLPMP